MLEVNGLSAGYQGNDVVHDVTFHVNQGEAVMIIGSNGAGKTTLFHAMCGLLSPSSGKVLFEGGDITWDPGRANRSAWDEVRIRRASFVSPNDG